MVRFLLLAMLCVAIPSVAMAQRTVLKLGATSWCPYTCEHEQRQGVIVEYITEILAKHDIEVRVEFYPWSRALQRAQHGELDGLITIAEGEGNGNWLAYTSHPTAYYQTCFYTRPLSPWLYHAPLELNGVKLGVVQGYGYGAELDNLVTSRDKGIVQITGSKVSSRLIHLLQRGRVDLIAMDKHVMSWGSNIFEASSFRERNAGCLEQEPFYLGLNTNYQAHAALIAILNREFADVANQRHLTRLFARLPFFDAH